MASAEGVAEDLRKTGKETKKDVGQMSQWRLMLRRFMENKLSVLGLIGLLIMYLLAAFASFIAPYDYNALDTNNQWQKPTPVTFAGGAPAICGVSQVLNEADFTWTYTRDCNTTYPVKFFVDGPPHKLLGLFPTTKHLFGVDAPADADPTPRLYLLGTDSLGRDMLARVLQGARISLTVGLVGVGIATVLGSIFGTASGYFGGAFDNIMQRLIELISSVPQIPLWAALAAALPRDLTVVKRYFFITLVLSLVAWTGLARQLRGKVISYRAADYTSAARAAGSSHTRIILTHMIPNALSHIIVVAALAIPGAILAETALSFLGLGMLPPAVSWGVLLSDAQRVDVILQYPWLMIPGAMVVVALIFYQFLGDGLRDAADPYS